MVACQVTYCSNLHLSFSTNWIEARAGMTITSLILCSRYLLLKIKAHVYIIIVVLDFWMLPNFYSLIAYFWS
jgi:hypothetical protein